MQNITLKDRSIHTYKPAVIRCPKIRYLGWLLARKPGMSYRHRDMRMGPLPSLSASTRILCSMPCHVTALEYSLIWSLTDDMSPLGYLPMALPFHLPALPFLPADFAQAWHHQSVSEMSCKVNCKLGIIIIIFKIS